ncbi:MAG: M15 family metallopeptidase [Lewinellaceae bacterium]|nr:M15 family metallopeptidase [Lewinellaceae bacterium]
MFRIWLCCIAIIVLNLSCKHSVDKTNDLPEPKENTAKKEIIKEEDTTEKEIEKTGINSVSTEFDEIIEEYGIQLDIRYATKNNFTKQQIYSCGKCFLRPDVKKKLYLANQYLREKYQYSLKLFDCYRPQPYQQKLWDVVPNPSYVTPPHKGSMHSRGSAVDLTIVDADGEELDMGTPYDFFGEEAHIDYTNLKPNVLKNRALLKKVMENYGFSAIRTEWWHFSFVAGNFALDSWVWPCN